MVPTTWNAGPRDRPGQRGAYEASLLNTPVADPNRPLEILRTIHSFDPCIACAVHVIDANGREYTCREWIRTAPRHWPDEEAPMQLQAPAIDPRHPRVDVGDTVAVYVWQYPLRLVHWGLVLSIGVLSFTGYYIHDPFIVGQVNRPFLMGWFRFAHELFGMIFIALFLMRIYLFFAGNRWVRWQAMVPLHTAQWKEMWEVMKFYAFINPKPVSKIGHNAMAAFSYIGIYTLVLVEIVTGLVMFNWLRHSPILGPLVGWIPRLSAFRTCG